MSKDNTPDDTGYPGKETPEVIYEDWDAYNSDQSTPKYGSNSRSGTLTGEFEYLEHRTTTKGRLVLDFLHLESDMTVGLFMNVCIQNPKTKKNYPTGRGGQFTVSLGQEFRKFWRKMFGKDPAAWSRAHHRLSSLKKMTFTGTAVRRRSADGGWYWKMIDINKKT